jgi:hypothetical protein
VLLALSACGGAETDADTGGKAGAAGGTVQVPPGPDAGSEERGSSENSPENSAENSAENSPAETGNATPMAERVATIGLLNKRNNVTQDFEMRPGETVEEGPVILRLDACERTAPHEFPEETGAFVQVEVKERGDTAHTRIFSGWLFKESPSLNVVEHPIYDVWIKDCAMSFPGDE